MPPHFVNYIAPGPIVKAAIAPTNARLASGQAFARAASTGFLRSKAMQQHLDASPCLQGNLFGYAYEDQMHPGGGSA